MDTVRRTFPELQLTDPYRCVSSPAGQQLEHQDAQRPVVCRDVVTFVEDDLWSHVLRRPAERPRLLTETDLLGKTKVDLK